MIPEGSSSSCSQICWRNSSMRLFLRHAGVLKQVSASTVVLKRLPFVSSGHWLHVSVARSASGDDGSQSADDGEGRHLQRRQSGITISCSIAALCRPLLLKYPQLCRCPAGAASERAKGLNRLPENATATEMREWADRMLRRSAADARPGGTNCPLTTQLLALLMPFSEECQDLPT